MSSLLYFFEIKKDEILQNFHLQIFHLSVSIIHLFINLVMICFLDTICVGSCNLYRFLKTNL